ncbi:uncharacterized protein Bfra_005104 [Botrytis fragariae]|uniref:Uncharacterized protein n=1 Tax=Botrytis fragariae TaxID=1964551 RepID=A0A8H6AUC2_9HELO|nr:uncharacterized protein Bfra_005104 [Botrytis fragariae]KAF5873640.1 hypothetical protein Bfra_005104 [Botrytis fragariae]
MPIPMPTPMRSLRQVVEIKAGGTRLKFFLIFPAGIEGLSRKRPIEISVSDLESTGPLQGVEPATLKMGLCDVDQGTGIWTIDVERYA